MDFLEFFAGGGMARAGLGLDWRCVYSNDYDAKKVASYVANWGDQEIECGDVKSVEHVSLPSAKLAWASFPCQDLSQAGAGAGLGGEHSGTFWPFWDKIKGLKEAGRAPDLVVLENVQGSITSHGGKDFAAICDALAGTGYRVGAVLIDAALFVPQSRLRLFVIGVSETIDIPEHMVSDKPQSPWHSRSLSAAARALPERTRQMWLWWKLPVPPPRRTTLLDLLDDDELAQGWHTEEETARLLALMSELHKKKLEVVAGLDRRVVGSVYKRRRTEEGVKRQRAEVRFDDVAGCLRTPTGGSSRQTVLIVQGENVRSRFLQPREAARLMGLDDEYLLPDNYYEAYHLVGDGVVVPVVNFLAKNILTPLAQQ
ncbi:MAG TPA: DNA (cytosine-5-)-methyltransferase [Devosia sp.]|jgi:DNA (cytosine-5)-methyltransferase 1|nr:DNA (cytosine-5-)-methyltransferase [Devosia sp.]